MMSSQGVNYCEQARRLGVDRQRVRRWSRRWAEHEEQLAKAEAKGASERDLKTLMLEILSDVQRPGGPVTFSAEQVVQLISVACEPPEESGRPVSHWTPTELAQEVAKRGIVESISPRQVGRFLKGGLSQARQDAILADVER